MTRPLTICMVTNNYAPYSGGVVSSIKALCAELRTQGHRVVIMTLDFEGALPEEDVERVFCVGHFVYKNNPMTIPIGMRYQLRRLFDTYRPDIVHVHHPFLLGVAARVVAREVGVPIVFMHHSLYEKYVHYVPMPGFLVRPIVKTIVSRFCDSVDRVIVPTPSIEQYLKKQAIKTPISIVPSGLLPVFTPTKKSDVTKKIGPKKFYRLLTVSRFAREKNIPWLLDMFKQLISSLPNQFVLELVGFGAELSALKKYAYQELQLSPEQVIFTKHPTKEQLLQAYRTADLFIFASQTETQGLVLAEAMSQATPVVALAGPGVNDIIIDGVNGYRVSSVKQMIACIFSLTSNQALYKQLSEGAYNTSLEYNPTRIAARMSELYGNLIVREQGVAPGRDQDVVLDL